jgi:hypothetical protein
MYGGSVTALKQFDCSLCGPLQRMGIFPSMYNKDELGDLVMWIDFLCIHAAL